jgi:hypothetical protein
MPPTHRNYSYGTRFLHALTGTTRCAAIILALSCLFLAPGVRRDTEVFASFERPTVFGSQSPHARFVIKELALPARTVSLLWITSLGTVRPESYGFQRVTLRVST